MRALVLAFVGGCLVAGGVPAGRDAASGPPASPSSAVSDPARPFTLEFLAAYNRHDIPAVLAMFSTHVRYSDCDYTQHLEVRFVSKAGVRRWLRTVFEEHDRLEHARILTSRSRPRVVGIVAMRVNDPLTIQGLAPHTTGGIKVILNHHRDRIEV